MLLNLFCEIITNYDNEIDRYNNNLIFIKLINFLIFLYLSANRVR